MGRVFFAVLIVVFVIISSGCTQNQFPQVNNSQSLYSEEAAREAAKEVVLKSPTYQYDGYGLVHKETVTYGCEGCWDFIFEFNSTHSGYGDRTGKVVAEVITPHTAVVRVRDGKIEGAVLDGEWDMIGQETVIQEQPEEPDEFCGSSTGGYCRGDSDCIITGCSDQLCASALEEPVVTTCEYMECYDYKRYGLECRCVNNRCQWI